MSTAIKVENLSKQYRLGEVGTGTVSNDLKRWWYRIRGKEDPFLRVGETNDRTSKGQSDYVWALKDVNFEIEQGDVVGIIGRNGAGKSTLLKILSKTTLPTTGTIKTRGRIASLLEVGTGFHPDLTGRDNIYLNGAILGMTKREIKAKFDEIVDFAGVARYIDTPVKRYSSGMYVRLAFAVAAHLESEILIVDEVLAVGDAEFQKKAIGKMQDVSAGQGRTVLFVSHNMGAVMELCNNGLLMKNGRVADIGNINNIVSSYLNVNEDCFEFNNSMEKVDKPEITYINIDKNAIKDGCLLLTFNFKAPVPLEPPVVGIVVNNEMGQPVFSTNPRMHSKSYDLSFRANEGVVHLKIMNVPLMTGKYSISCFLGDMIQDYNAYIDVLTFDFLAKGLDNTKLPDIKYIGSINLENSQWEIENI